MVKIAVEIQVDPVAVRTYPMYPKIVALLVVMELMAARMADDPRLRRSRPKGNKMRPKGSHASSLVVPARWFVFLSW